jgi:hypothetical protein
MQSLEEQVQRTVEGTDVFRQGTMTIIRRKTGLINASINGLEAPEFSCKELQGKF